ncbi:MAG: hypothetical protein LBU32_29690 [Clostridiales bacterium]|jgi:cytochrome c biogenesis protein CcdA|nr:hypothetical protein [Clostridiales bacterium]
MKKINAPIVAAFAVLLAFFQYASVLAEESPRFTPSNPNDSTLVCFVSTACESCFKTKEFLATLDEEYPLDGGGSTKVALHVININEGDGSQVIRQFFEAYKVSPSDQRTPILFYSKGYLAGDPTIQQNLVYLIKLGAARGFDDRFLGAASAAGPSMSIPAVFAAGLVGGVNPCSISLALLLLTLVANKRDKILKVGFTYISSKLITYLALGLFLYSFIQALDSAVFRNVQGILKWVAGGLALGLAFFNILDFFSARGEKYGKIKVQLPARLRNFNNNLIKRALARDSLIILTVFLVGAAISAGEFLCTGQVYIATILYILKSSPGNYQTLAAFFTYVIAMVIPMSLMVVFVAYGKRLLELSEFARKRMPAIKLANAFLFLCFAYYIIFSK